MGEKPTAQNRCRGYPLSGPCNHYTGGCFARGTQAHYDKWKDRAAQKQETQLQRALQAYSQAIEQKKLQSLIQQAGPPIGSKEYVKQVSGKVYQDTKSLESPWFPVAWYGASAVAGGAGVAYFNTTGFEIAQEAYEDHLGGAIATYPELPYFINQVGQGLLTSAAAASDYAMFGRMVQTEIKQLSKIF